MVANKRSASRKGGNCRSPDWTTKGSTSKRTNKQTGHLPVKNNPFCAFL